nr:immunoglobulin light chain junction region [Macaca mulatta]MOX69312.1 immunoglobulin light chain junction region [Macaca mulatta]MOX69385.1 immunoglobulin light chain junction region [Macaca mulatta]MOX70502.1 immunoglobulin light chain junction region [Macaca mulatta]MOX71011.1 immunoglobulin light chain junction region [Macaca mulatta]
DYYCQVWDSDDDYPVF